MARRIQSISAVLCIIAAAACGGDSTDSSPVDPVSFVFAEDIANEGDGRDLEVRFWPPTNTEPIVEYRIAVYPADTAASATAEDVASLADERVTALAPAGADQVITTLGADAVDATGAPLVEGVEYRAVVASVGDAPENLAIAEPSPPVVLAQTTISVTYLGGDGVMIDDGSTKVIIDALHAAEGSWVELPSNERLMLERGDGIYADIDIAMVTHNHGDHFSPTAIGRFLDNHPDVTVLAPPQVTSSLGGRPQVMPVSPARGERIDLDIDGVGVSVLHVRHFDQFGNDFSNVDNYGFLIELGGLNLLHFGDVDYSEENLAPFDLPSADIDTVFLPTFNTLLTEANATIVTTHVGPEHVVALHFLVDRLASEGALVDELYPGSTRFVLALQVLRR
jgi:L-ascorbate metabolism protein UlaG (beta-lactamase superfamily)